MQGSLDFPPTAVWCRASGRRFVLEDNDSDDPPDFPSTRYLYEGEGSGERWLRIGPGARFLVDRLGDRAAILASTGGGPIYWYPAETGALGCETPWSRRPVRHAHQVPAMSASCCAAGGPWANPFEALPHALNRAVREQTTGDAARTGPEWTVETAALHEGRGDWAELDAFYDKLQGEPKAFDEGLALQFALRAATCGRRGRVETLLGAIGAREPESPAADAHRAHVAGACAWMLGDYGQARELWMAVPPDGREACGLDAPIRDAAIAAGLAPVEPSDTGIGAQVAVLTRADAAVEAGQWSAAWAALGDVAVAGSHWRDVIERRAVVALRVTDEDALLRWFALLAAQARFEAVWIYGSALMSRRARWVPDAAELSQLVADEIERVAQQLGAAARTVER